MHECCCFLSLAIMLSILHYQDSVSAAACSFYCISTQPPTSLDHCNPYFYSHDEPRQYLSIPCVVRRMSDNAGSFDVHWFRRTPEGEVRDLGRVLTVSETVNRISIRLTFYNMVCTNFMAAGDYWCQVVNTTAQPHTKLGMSNVLRIGYPNHYNPLSLSTCTGDHRNKTNTCADLPASHTADRSLESTISSSKVLNPTLSFTSSTDTARITSIYSLPVVGKSNGLEVQVVKPTLTDIQTTSHTHNKSALGNKYVMVVSTPCFAGKETISAADDLTQSETTIPMPTSVFVSSQNSNDAASFTTSQSNRDLMMSHLVYPIIVSILVLVIVILSAIISIQCYRKKGTRGSDREEQLPEPQPYMEPIRTLPRENNSIGSEQGTTSLTERSILWMNNLSKASNPPISIKAASLNQEQDHEMLNEYESLNTSTLEPSKDYTMVNKLCLKSNEPPSGLTF